MPPYFQCIFFIYLFTELISLPLSLSLSLSRSLSMIYRSLSLSINLSINLPRYIYILYVFICIYVFIHVYLPNLIYLSIYISVFHPSISLSLRYDEDELPKVDVFVCTADPTIEPPALVVNTVLSVMAYQYPPQKLSVYLSDDGGSDLTFYALLEAARFARVWIPFCHKFHIEPRSPAAFFRGAAADEEHRAVLVIPLTA